MANPEHLEILKKGVHSWNDWREVNPHTIPDLVGADLKKANLYKFDLRLAKLDYVNLYQSDLRAANLSGASLNDTNLLSTNCGGTIMKEAQLVQANMTNTNLSHADLRNSRLFASHFMNSQLDSSSFAGAELSATLFTDTDLSKVKDLEKVEHLGPSYIDIDSIYKSKGKIPVDFLKGIGVPDSFIEYTQGLTGDALQLFSCFISYSNRDHDFVERLHSDLQNNSVRCWYAREDLKIGEKIRYGIDEAIRTHDKLLLILSENSIESDWVEKEVETAFEQERRLKKTILFPIRLDDAVMETEQSWAADIRRTRHIGDFTDWKNHDSYKKSFERLLRDLKANETIATPTQ